MHEEDAMQILKQLGGMMGDAATMGIMQQLVVAYDQIAVAAMRSLLEVYPGISRTELAEKAWEIADSMMIERAKRGLGKVPNSK